MATGSMKEAVKALTSAFSAQTTPYPLPDELVQTIQTFLDRHQDIDEHEAQRLQDELVPIYTKYVGADSEKNPSFICALRQLLPAIRGDSRLEQWWDLAIGPTIDGMGHKRHDMEEAREFLQSVLVFDPEDDVDGSRSRLSVSFTTKLLDAYIAHTAIPLGEDDVVSPEDEYIARELESVLVAFGRCKPKELLHALNQLFLQGEHRIGALNLLSAFVRLQPPHLHLALETDLIHDLEKCLLLDESATVIELALIVLIMFLPHITGSLTSDGHLPRLFLIYSRILCWDKLRIQSSEEQRTQYDLHVYNTWQKVERSSHSTETGAPYLLHFFTFLYGLFPLNFMGYVRKPRKYLKAIDYPGADVFSLDQDLIRRRTEPFRQVHLLHPNMFTTTAEDELSENRWVRSDPADVVTECMGLCVAVSASLDDPGPPPTGKLPDIPGPLVRTEDIPHDALSLSGVDGANDETTTSWRNTQSTMFSPSNNWPSDVSEAPPKSTLSTYSRSIPKSSKSPTPVLKSSDIMDSPTLPAASNDDAAQHAPLSQPIASQSRLDELAQTITRSPMSNTQTNTQGKSTAALQREIMLLRNGLNFERYLKLQHLSHIGQLQRKHIKEATIEAETQNLINTNRTLKAKLAKANEMYAQLKKETVTSRSQSKKWESELSYKVRSYRDEQRNWQSEDENLRLTLQRTQQDCQRLRMLVTESEAREQKLRALQSDLQDLDSLRQEVESLQEKAHRFQEHAAELETVTQERDDLRNELEMTNMKLNSRDMDKERSMRAYERKITELESRLQPPSRGTPPGQLPSSVQQMLDSALAASHAKLQQMKKTHYHLLEQYTELQMRCHELEGERRADMGRFNGQDPSNRDSLQQVPPRQNSILGDYGSKQTYSTTSDEYGYPGEYGSPVSPSSTTGPPIHQFSARPVRLESLSQPRAPREPVSPTLDLSAAYETSLNASFQLQNAGDAAMSSGKSGYSVDTNSSKGDKKERIAPKSEVRVYGRGGAQNIGKKSKDKPDKKDKQSKSGGFRGLKGIM